MTSSMRKRLPRGSIGYLQLIGGVYDSRRPNESCVGHEVIPIIGGAHVNGTSTWHIQI